MPPVPMKLIWLVAAVLVWWLAVEGNLGKALACIIAPADLSVVGQTQTGTATNASPTQPS